jgi:hypothetical protein
MRIMIALAVLVGVGACATPCVDDGLLQKFCPPDEASTEGATETDASASATDSVTASASVSVSASQSVSDSDSAGDGCDAELFQSANIPANVLIVLDRSGSMNQSIGGGAGTKWEVALEAIDQFVTEFGNQARFGLMLYPGYNLSCSEGMTCSTGEVFVDPGPMTTAAILQTLDDAQTCSFGTPTAETLEDLLDYPGLEDPTRPNHILIITDGDSTCEDPVPVVAALRNKEPEIKTYVLGFGGGVNPDELAAMAEAGGTALPGDPSYYQADDAASLDAALASIGGEFLTCSYALSKPLDDPDQLYVLFDGIQVPRDPGHTNGWDHDAASNTVTFYGAACDALQSGEVKDLQMVYGC